MDQVGVGIVYLISIFPPSVRVANVKAFVRIRRELVGGGSVFALRNPQSLFFVAPGVAPTKLRWWSYSNLDGITYRRGPRPQITLRELIPLRVKPVIAEARKDTDVDLRDFTIPIVI